MKMMMSFSAAEVPFFEVMQTCPVWILCRLAASPELFLGYLWVYGQPTLRPYFSML